MICKNTNAMVHLIDGDTDFFATVTDIEIVLMNRNDANV